MELFSLVPPITVVATCTLRKTLPAPFSMREPAAPLLHVPADGDLRIELEKRPGMWDAPLVVTFPQRSWEADLGRLPESAQISVDVSVLDSGSEEVVVALRHGGALHERRVAYGTTRERQEREAAAAAEAARQALLAAHAAQRAQEERTLPGRQGLLRAAELALSPWGAWHHALRGLARARLDLLLDLLLFTAQPGEKFFIHGEGEGDCAAAAAEARARAVALRGWAGEVVVQHPCLGATPAGGGSGAQLPPAAVALTREEAMAALDDLRGRCGTLADSVARHAERLAELKAGVLRATQGFAAPDCQLSRAEQLVLVDRSDRLRRIGLGDVALSADAEALGRLS